MSRLPLLESKPRFRKARKGSRIGDFLKRKRVELGVTQLELSRMVGVGFNFIRQLEQGKQSVRLDKVTQVLNFFGYEVDVTPQNRKYSDPEGDNKK